MPISSTPVLVICPIALVSCTIRPEIQRKSLERVDAIHPLVSGHICTPLPCLKVSDCKLIMTHWDSSNRYDACRVVTAHSMSQHSDVEPAAPFPFASISGTTFESVRVLELTETSETAGLFSSAFSGSLLFRTEPGTLSSQINGKKVVRVQPETWSHWGQNI